MGRLASSLVVVGALGFVASFASAVGCAGNGAADEPLPDVSTNLPAEGGASSGSKIGAPKGDGGKDPTNPGDEDPSDDDDYLPLDGGGKKDSGVDAGPPLPPAPDVGSPCPTQDQILTVACGTCGTKTTVCEKKQDGSLGWSAYGPCGGEHGDCVAGTTRTDGCNNCGERTDTCSAQCKWTTGTCTTAANSGCVPGSYDIVNAGCDGPDLGLFRTRQCSATCAYETNYSQTCQSAPTAIEVGPTVGSISSTLVTLAGQLASISTGSCPIGSSYTFGPSTAYAYTQIHNPLSKEVTVFVYHSAQAGTVFDTSMTAYKGDQAPTTVDARRDCLKTSAAGNTTYTVDARFASLDTTKAVTIPAGGWVTVYSTAEKAGVNGTVKFNVRTATVGTP